MELNKQSKHLLALTAAARKAPDKTKLKAKIKKVKQAQAWNKFLAQ